MAPEYIHIFALDSLQYVISPQSFKGFFESMKINRNVEKQVFKILQHFINLTKICSFRHIQVAHRHTCSHFLSQERAEADSDPI